MHRTNSRSVLLHWGKHSRIEGASRMQNDSSAQFFAANSREFCGNNRNFIVRYCDQDNFGGNNLTRHAGTRLARANETNSPACAGFTAGHDDADFPALFAQSAPKRTRNAASSDNRQGFVHAC